MRKFVTVFTRARHWTLYWQMDPIHMRTPSLYWQMYPIHMLTPSLYWQMDPIHMRTPSLDWQMDSIHMLTPSFPKSHEINTFKNRLPYSPPSSAEVKEWVELYLHSSNTPSWRGAQLKHRDNFTFTFTFTDYHSTPRGLRHVLSSASRKLGSRIGCMSAFFCVAFVLYR